MFARMRADVLKALHFNPSTTRLTTVANPGPIAKQPPYFRLSTSNESVFIKPLNALGFGSHRAAKQMDQLLSQAFPTDPAVTLPRHPHRTALTLIGGWGAGTAALVAFLVLNLEVQHPLRQLAALADQSVLIAGDAHLLHLTPDGETGLAQKRLAEVGVTDDLTTLRVEPQGTLLIGDRRQKTIKRCDLGAWKCRTLPGLPTETPLFQNAFTFAVDPGSSRLLVSDIDRHHILELNLDGQLTRTVWSGHPLCFPRHVTLEAGQLVVANTGHHKIQRFTLDASPQLMDTWLTVKKGRERATCPKLFRLPWRERIELKRKDGEAAQPFALATSTRLWPIMVERDVNGAWWVFNANREFKRSDVLRFETPTSTPSLILHGSDHDPVALLPRAQDVLVADLENIAILRFDLAGKFLGEFGNGVLQAQRDTYRQQERHRMIVRVQRGALMVWVAMSPLSSEDRLSIILAS